MLAKVSAAVNPFHGADRATDLKCAVVRLPLSNGISRFDRSVALETDKLGVSASGTVNLRDETLDVALHPSIRQGVRLDISQVAQLVRLRGPWRDPHVTIDATTSVATIAKLGAAMATGGLPALGGLLVLGAATEDGPCAVASGAASARPSEAKKGSPPSPAENLLEGLGRLLQR